MFYHIHSEQQRHWPDCTEKPFFCTMIHGTFIMSCLVFVICVSPLGASGFLVLTLCHSWYCQNKLLAVSEVEKSSCAHEDFTKNAVKPHLYSKSYSVSDLKHGINMSVVHNFIFTQDSLKWIFSCRCSCTVSQLSGKHLYDLRKQKAIIDHIIELANQWLPEVATRTLTGALRFCRTWSVYL